MESISNTTKITGFEQSVTTKKSVTLETVTTAFEESLSKSLENNKHFSIEPSKFERYVHFSTENVSSPSVSQIASPLIQTSSTEGAVALKTSSAPLSAEIKRSSVTDYQDIITEMSNKYNVPEKLIYSVIQTESNFKSDAVSGSGAMGLMQLMPATAKWLGVDNAFDPKQNIEGGVKYLSQMLKKYDGDTTLALAAYNAGPGNVDKYGGVPPFKETQNYIKKILG